MTQATATELDEEFRRFMVEAWANPHPFYERLRAHDPVYRTPFGFYYITTYAEGEAVLRDGTRFSTQPPNVKEMIPLPPGSVVGEFLTDTMLFLGGSDHERLRKLVMRVFTKRGIESLRDQVRGTLDDLADSAFVGEEIEFIDAFCMPLPTRVILDVLGISHEHFDKFAEMSHLLLQSTEMGFAPEWIERANVAFDACGEFVTGLMHVRARNPTDDLFTQMIQVREGDGDRLSESELRIMVMFLVTAGFETTTNSLANAMYRMLSDRELFERLRADRSLLPGFIEEVMRCDGGIRTSTPRWALEELTIGEKTIAAGEMVKVCLHAADHDPAVFADPYTFDIKRAPNRHIAFGQGPHFCLGAQLARLEIQLALDTVLDRYPNIRLATDDITWRPGTVMRALTALPVRW